MKRVELVIGATLVLTLCLVAVVAMIWTPHDPTQVIPTDRLQPPSAQHWLGTDRLGADIASQLMVGARVCLLVGLVAVAIAAALGVPLGVVAAMNRGWTDEGIMRATDVMFAFPGLLLAILLSAALGGSTLTVMVAIGLATVPVFTRVSRAAALGVVASDYVLAARVAGTGQLAVALRHVAPNIAPMVGVQASVSFGVAILAEAGLSFLGIGAPVSSPTWGKMLFEARSVLHSHPELALWPGACIALAVLGFNLLGDGLRDTLDPRLREVR